MDKTSRTILGVEEFLRSRCAALRGLRVGAILNPTSLDAQLNHLADLLHGPAREMGVQLVWLFGPEHGVRGDVQYLEEVPAAIDARTGLPAHSLYGKTFASLTPTDEQLHGLDALVFDIQDVGSRYYTCTCDDEPLHAGRGEAQAEVRGARSAQPDRRPARRGRLVSRIRIVRRPLAHGGAPRDDRGRDRAAPAAPGRAGRVRYRLRAGGGGDVGLAARTALPRDAAALGNPPRRTCPRPTPRWCTQACASSRGPT